MKMQIHRKTHPAYTQLKHVTYVWRKMERYLINQDNDNDESAQMKIVTITTPPFYNQTYDLNCNSIDDVDETFCADSSACNYYENASNTSQDLCIYATNTCDSCSGESDGTGKIVNGDIIMIISATLSTVKHHRHYHKRI